MQSRTDGGCITVSIKRLLKLNVDVVEAPMLTKHGSSSSSSAMGRLFGTVRKIFLSFSSVMGTCGTWIAEVRTETGNVRTVLYGTDTDGRPIFYTVTANFRLNFVDVCGRRVERRERPAHHVVARAAQ